MKKIVLLSVAGIFVLGIAVGGLWWLNRPQVMQLDKNTKLTLLGVDYGKHHKPPAVKTIGRRGGQSFDTTNDTLVVWILQETKGGGARYGWQALVSDRAETASVQSWARSWSDAGTGRQIAGVQLDAFPRRDSKFLMRFMSWGSNGQHTSKEQFVISNPARVKSFSKWTPEPLPDTQTDGDLSVTLNKLVIAPSPWGRNGTSKNDPVNRVAQFDFDAQEKGLSATNWRPVQAGISDATGNNITGWVNEYRANSERDGYFCQSVLWPNEPAWKVRLEFSRTSGFSTDELWPVTDIPVKAGTQQDAQNLWNSNRNRSGRTNAPFGETTVNGIHFKVFGAIRYTDPNQGGQQTVSVSFNADPDPATEGLRLTPLKVTDDQGRPLQNWGSSWGGGNFQYTFRGGHNTASLNLTLAVHKSRFVEFTVKPTKQ